MYRILIVHNEYRNPGGEDVVVAQEVEMLRSAGHAVFEYHRSNHEIDTLGWWDKATLPKRVIWADDTVRDLRLLMKQEKPDIVHFHNTFVMVSPAAYYAVREMGVPVVQTLHNYRLICPRADFFRDGRICEDCLGKAVPWPAILHGCYHGSRIQNAGVAAILTVHRWLKTFQEQVDIYIALSEFSRRKMIEGGLPAEKICCLPNCVVPDPGERTGTGDYAIFAGRFSPEERVQIVLEAWKRLRGIPLKIVGSGPEERELRRIAETSGLNQVGFCGWQPREKAIAAIKKAAFLIFPSQWYETFGLAICEAFACGVPVIATRLGVMEEMVEDGRMGLHFTPGDPEDLAAKVEWAWTHPGQMAAMGRAARAEFEAKYSASRNYEMLMQIFDKAVSRSKANGV